MDPRDDTGTIMGLRSDRVATVAILLAIAVSLGGACLVIIESAAEPPVRHEVTSALA